MREALRTLALALGALAIFAAVFAGGRLTPSGPAQARPTSSETHAVGYAELAARLRAAGIATQSVLQPLDELFAQRSTAQGAPAANGDLLVVTLPAARPFRSEELGALDAWVRAGNTLWVFAALAERPEWAASAAESALLFDVATLTGFEFEPIGLDADAPLAAAQRGAASTPSLRARLTGAWGLRVLQPAHAANGGDGGATGEGRDAALHAAAPGAAMRYALRDAYEPLALRIAASEQRADAGVWLRRVGRGQIVLSTLASPLGNAGLAVPGNAEALAVLLADALAPDTGRVSFADFHQGAGGLVTADQLLADPRWRGTFALLIGAWLLWVLGSAPALSSTGTPTQGPASAAAPAAVLTAAQHLRRIVPEDLAALHLLRLFERRHEIAPDSHRARSAAALAFMRDARIAPGDAQQLELARAALGATRAEADAARLRGTGRDFAALAALLARIERARSRSNAAVAPR